MNEREELARLLDDAAPDDCPISFFFGAPTGHGLRFADAILAAGYRKPRTITTAEELDALPVNSVILDDIQDVIRKVFVVGWETITDGGFLDTESISLPATVLWEPEQ